MSRCRLEMSTRRKRYSHATSHVHILKQISRARELKLRASGMFSLLFGTFSGLAALRPGATYSTMNASGGEAGYCQLAHRTFYK